MSKKMMGLFAGASMMGGGMLDKAKGLMGKMMLGLPSLKVIGGKILEFLQQVPGLGKAITAIGAGLGIGGGAAAVAASAGGGQSSGDGAAGGKAAASEGVVVPEALGDQASPEPAPAGAVAQSVAPGPEAAADGFTYDPQAAGRAVPSGPDATALQAESSVVAESQIQAEREASFS